MKQLFYSNGKLLLTGEYLVLNGAPALAIPTTFGQSLVVEKNDKPKIIWKSLDEKGDTWFECEFIPDEITTSKKNENHIGSLITKQLFEILNEAKKLNPNFLNTKTGYKITTTLSFPRNWGLGTSSTLITNIANWAKIDAFTLLKKTFGGSGYDIAAAQHNSPITYSILNGKSNIEIVKLPWSFTNQLFFIHLNKKQNSREAIILYNSQAKNKSLALCKISDITTKIISCNNLHEFEILITQHEEIISKIIKLKPVKELLFHDYQGAIKSLGAWGGDFILVTGKEEDMNYFRKKGYKTIIPFKDMIK